LNAVVVQFKMRRAKTEAQASGCEAEPAQSAAQGAPKPQLKHPNANRLDPPECRRLSLWLLWFKLRWHGPVA